MLNATTEREAVLEIMDQTQGNPAERDRRLNQLVKDHNLCGGVICKCDEPGHFCPRHGVNT